MNVKKDAHEIDDFFDNYYFIITKKLQIYSGFWPYESRFNKIIPRIFLYGTIIAGVTPLLLGFRKWCILDFYLDICGENIIGISYALTAMSRYGVTAMSENKFKNIYERIAENWLKITDPKEQRILEEYARLARIKVVVYLMFMILTGFCFCQVPMIPIMLDYIKPLNESRPKILFLRGYYVFDPIKHFFKLYIFFVLAGVINIITMIGIDGTYTVIIHQILGILMIVKYRIHLATLYVDSFKDVSFDVIIKAIHLHKEVLKFIDLIETTHKLLFLIEIANTIIFMSIGIVVTLEDSTFLILLRNLLAISGAVLHFLYVSWPGQNIIDHSIDLFLSTYTSEWYNIPEKSKTLLKIIMLRTMKPCIFTAGGLYIMNLENFGSIIKSAVSYIAVVSSFR